MYHRTVLAGGRNCLHDLPCRNLRRYNWTYDCSMYWRLPGRVVLDGGSDCDYLHDVPCRNVRQYNWAYDGSMYWQLRCRKVRQYDWSYGEYLYRCMSRWKIQ